MYDRIVTTKEEKRDRDGIRSENPRMYGVTRKWKAYVGK